MPRSHEPPDDDNDNEGFDPEDYGFSEEQWDDLLDEYGFESAEEMLDAFPEMADFGDFMDGLDYMDELDNLGDDDDFYG